MRKGAIATIRQSHPIEEDSIWSGVPRRDTLEAATPPPGLWDTHLPAHACRGLKLGLKPKGCPPTPSLPPPPFPP